MVDLYSIDVRKNIFTLLDIERNLGEEYGVVIHKIYLQRRVGKWRALLKGTQEGANVIAFLNAETLPEMFSKLGYISDSNVLLWYPDRYP